MGLLFLVRLEDTVITKSTHMNLQTRLLYYTREIKSRSGRSVCGLILVPGLWHSIFIGIVLALLTVYA